MPDRCRRSMIGEVRRTAPVSSTAEATPGSSARTRGGVCHARQAPCDRAAVELLGPPERQANSARRSHSANRPAPRRDQTVAARPNLAGSSPPTQCMRSSTFVSTPIIARRATAPPLGHCLHCVVNVAASEADRSASAALEHRSARRCCACGAASMVSLPIAHRKRSLSPCRRSESCRGLSAGIVPALDRELGGRGHEASLRSRDPSTNRKALHQAFP